MDVSALTCEQVNRELAKRRGDVMHQPLYELSSEPGDEGHIKATVVGHKDLFPDYCHDWRWAGVLLEEMWPNLDVEEGRNGGVVVFGPAYDEDGYAIISHGETLQEAIARAWLQMYLEEEDA